MELGINILGGIDLEKQISLFKKLGVTRTMMGTKVENLDETIDYVTANGIIVDNLHAPFDNINDMWGDDEAAGGTMLNRLKYTVDKCAEHNIPATVVHVSSGRPMPEITDAGVKRYDEILSYAKKKGVKVALENLRYFENLKFLMDRYPDAGFCYDNGHESCRGTDIRYMDFFGKRTIALHIHDNRCELDTDDHLLPFDGKVDFDKVAKDIANSGFDGTLMLEIGKNASIDGEMVYDNLTDEEFIERAVSSARKLADMIENIKNANQ